jgi:hypothetical protein
MINFTVDVTGMDDILGRLDPNRVGPAITAMVTGTMRLLLRYSQINAPVREGNLRRSGFMQVSADGLSAIVGYGSKYAGSIEDGSRAHEIAAVNARSLAFIPTSFATLSQAVAASNGSRRSGAVKSNKSAQSVVMFRQYVEHPGTISNPFLVNGWDDAQAETSAWLAEVGSRYVGGEEPPE